MRILAIPDSVPLSSGTSGGQDAKPVRASASFWRPTIGEQRKGAQRAGIVRGVLFLMGLLDKQKIHATRRAEEIVW